MNALSVEFFRSSLATGDSDGRESACKAGDLGLIPGSERSPWRRERLPTPVLLPGESHGQRSLVGYSPWGQTLLTQHHTVLIIFIMLYIASLVFNSNCSLYFLTPSSNSPFPCPSPPHVNCCLLSSQPDSGSTSHTCLVRR